MRIRTSEIFGPTIQGEGLRTGVRSVWVRFFGCNLECSGFGQVDPTRPETYALPYKTVDLSNIAKLEDLPVFNYGCDSSYSWSQRFKHLAKDYTEVEIGDILNGMVHPTDGWLNSVTNTKTDLCFTGGETMMYQKPMIAILDYLMSKDCSERKWFSPFTVQIETNGTVALSDLFRDYMRHSNYRFCMNISPKLYNVSGEERHKAWKPEVIFDYVSAANMSCLKFVMNDSEESWKELNSKVNELSNEMILPPIYVMPVGATKDQQENSEVIARIANRAIAEGYHVSSRVHAIIWGNTIGV